MAKSSGLLAGNEMYIEREKKKRQKAIAEGTRRGNI